MKVCRFCKKDDLHDEAIRCPYCGSDLRRWIVYLSWSIRGLVLVIACLIMILLGAIISLFAVLG